MPARCSSSLGRGLMKKIWLLVFLAQGCCLFAQNNLNNRYVMRPRTDDLLYFILPFDMPCVVKGKAANLDLTYITSETRVRVNMSLWTPDPLSVDSVVVVSGSSCRVDSLTSLFVEKAKKAWWHRLSFYIDFDTLTRLYEPPEPYRLCVHAGGTVQPYAFPVGKWPAERRQMSELLRMIEYNRRTR